MRNENEIKIKEDVKIGNIILEKGDKIEVLEAITTIVVDVVGNDDGKKYAANMGKKYNIKGTVIGDSPNGDPEIKFIGKEADLLKFFIYYNGGDKSMEADFYDLYS